MPLYTWIGECGCLAGLSPSIKGDNYILDSKNIYFSCYLKVVMALQNVGGYYFNYVNGTATSINGCGVYRQFQKLFGGRVPELPRDLRQYVRMLVQKYLHNVWPFEAPDV